jgi:hypothetical protein
MGDKGWRVEKMVVFVEKVRVDSKEVVEKVGEAKKVEFWEMEEEE